MPPQASSNGTGVGRATKNELAAAVGEDRRSAAEMRPILRATAGREPSDVAKYPASVAKRVSFRSRV